MADVLDAQGNPINGSLATASSQKLPSEVMEALLARQAMTDEWNRCAQLFDQVLSGSLAGNQLAALIESDPAFAAYYANRIGANG